MRGRPTCPTGQEKNSVGATGGSPPFLFLQGKVGYRVAPSSAPVCALGHLPPKGKALRCASLPVCKTTSPSPPSRWAGRYGRWFMGRRPGKKRRRTPAGSSQLEKVGPGRKNLFLPGVLSSGFLPKKAGPPPGAGRATGRCAPRAASEPPTRRVRSPAPACQGPHQTGTLFFAQFCATFLPPPCTPACNFGPGSPGGERRFCHAHPP